jgi:hypothetical protein
VLLLLAVLMTGRIIWTAHETGTIRRHVAGTIVDARPVEVISGNSTRRGVAVMAASEAAGWCHEVEVTNALSHDDQRQRARPPIGGIQRENQDGASPGRAARPTIAWPTPPSVVGRPRATDHRGALGGGRVWSRSGPRLRRRCPAAAGR